MSGAVRLSAPALAAALALCALSACPTQPRCFQADKLVSCGQATLDERRACCATECEGKLAAEPDKTLVDGYPRPDGNCACGFQTVDGCGWLLPQLDTPGPCPPDTSVIDEAFPPTPDVLCFDDDGGVRPGDAGR